eukprot:scaffold1690_cov182-Amphora_coffeaeformis.AAC.27
MEIRDDPFCRLSSKRTSETRLSETETINTIQCVGNRGEERGRAKKKTNKQEKGKTTTPTATTTS